MRDSTRLSAEGSELGPDTGADEFGKLRWFDWWYRLSVPAKPDESASFRQRDIYRRALLASVILCLMLALVLCALFISLFARNGPNILVASCVMVILLGALLLNRAGLLIIEGIVVVGLWTVGEFLTFVAQPSLDISNVMQYDLLTVGILLAVVYFPSWSAFAVGVFNCLLIWLSIVYLKPTPALAQLIQHDGLSRLLTRPISLTVVIMLVTYLWSRSGHQALQRADRAETIAKLRHDLADRDMAMMLQKTRVDHSIQSISDVLSAYSNGNATVRVPMTANNVLWNISGPINNLLGRAQRTRQAEAELERMRPALHQLEHENATLRTALQKQGGSPFQAPPLQRWGNNAPDARPPRGQGGNPFHSEGDHNRR
ncbi:MAG: hypothetical protein M3Y81_05745 [Chloroflexota bacterium]|nr:hypothetical protein [Chloroflexota bacterium]